MKYSHVGIGSHAFAMFAHKKITGVRGTLTTLYQTLYIVCMYVCMYVCIYGSACIVWLYYASSSTVWWFSDHYFFLLSVWSPCYTLRGLVQSPCGKITVIITLTPLPPLS